MNPVLFYIVLTIIMPKDQQDLIYRHDEPSYQQCLADAKEFLDHDLPDVIKDAQGKGASCWQRGLVLKEKS